MPSSHSMSLVPWCFHQPPNDTPVKALLDERRLTCADRGDTVPGERGGARSSSACTRPRRRTTALLDGPRASPASFGTSWVIVLAHASRQP
jgi:hypothetical protein